MMYSEDRLSIFRHYKYPLIYPSRLSIVIIYLAYPSYLPHRKKLQPGESWALLCSSALLLKSDAEDFVAILGATRGTMRNALNGGMDLRESDGSVCML